MPKKTAAEYATGKKPKSEKKPSKTVDATVEAVLKDFDASWKYAKTGHHDRWDRNEKLYHGERTKRGYIGISDTFVPMAFSTVETKVSALFGTKPKFNYLAPRSKPDQKTDILNALVDYYWDKDQWSIKVINTGRSGLKKGNGVDYFAWNIDHPIMVNVPLRDFFIDPNATTMENARYMGRRYLTSIEELESFEVVDPETGDMRPKYDLSKLKKLKEEKKTDGPKTQQKNSEQTTDKEEKDMFYGSTVEGQDQVEIIEWWGYVVEDGKVEEKVISIADRCAVIESVENYFKAKARANGDKNPVGIMPFAGFRCYVDESQFYAKSEVDVIADQQEDLNDITNQNKDAITYTLNQMYTLDPKYAEYIEDVENLPGAVYPFEQNALMPVQRGTIPPDAFNERLNIKNEIRETTASNEMVKGGSAEGGKATATEINAQIAGAGQRINLMVTQIEDEYFHRIGRILFAMIRLYVTEPMMVRIVGKDGARWEEFNPEDFKDGDYEPRVQLNISVENKKAEEASQAKEMMAAFLGDPDVNQQELKKLVLAKGFQLDPDEVETLMTPVVDPMMEGMGGEMPIDPMTDPMAEVMPPMPEEDMMPDPAVMEALAPEPEMMAPEGVLVDPVTGAQFQLDPITGQLIPLTMVEEPML